MDRNTLLAFALSMMVFVAYLAYSGEQRARIALEAGTEGASRTESVAGEADSPGGRAPSETAAEGAAAPSGSGGSPARIGGVADSASGETGDVVPGWQEPAPQTSTIRNARVVARISNGPALIEGWSLVDYVERRSDGSVPIDLVEAGLPVLQTTVAGVVGADFLDTRFEVVRESGREVVQRAVSSAGVLTRTIRLDQDGYGFDLELAFESHRRDPVDARFEVLWPAGVSQRKDFNEVSLLAYGGEEGVTRELVQAVGGGGFLGFGGSEDGKQRVAGRSRWAGFDIRYFTGVVIDASGSARLDVEFEPLVPKESARARAALPSMAIGAGGELEDALRGYFGPKDPSLLEATGSGLEHTVNRGWSWLEPLTRFFEIALDWLYAFIPNYGIAIIVLTVLVRVFTAPLMVKQMRSAERMRDVQPRVKAIQERYKDDRQKQSEEMMKLYRDEGVNPLAGCLPLMLQFPVLIGLFYSLRSSIGLRQAPFMLWIDDLSEPELLFTIPGLDFPFRVLPLIMAASMYFQQKMTPNTGMDPVQARMMLVMMPAMMLLISYTFPSGLVLYWTVSNLLGIAHQYWIRRQRQPAG